MRPGEQQIEQFLWAVDESFPIPLSHKQDLHLFAKKLFEKATLCTEIEQGRILAMVAGYTENVTDDLAYISVVATLPEARGRRLASALIERFIAIARERGLRAVHLYTVRTNTSAMRMYQRLGFSEWVKVDEPRPEDVHLIYRLK